MITGIVMTIAIGAVMLFGPGKDDKKMQTDTRWNEFVTVRKPHIVALEAAIAGERVERDLYHSAKAEGDQPRARHHAARAYAFAMTALESKREIERLARKTLVTPPAGVKCVRDAASTAIGKLADTQCRKWFDELNAPHVNAANAMAAAQGARTAAQDARKSRRMDRETAKQLACIADDLEAAAVKAQAAADATPIDADKLEQILDCPDAIQSPSYAVLVTAKILKGRRWAEAEPLLATDPSAAFDYSSVIGEPFDLGEPAIMGHPGLWARYCKRFGVGGSGAISGSGGSSSGTPGARP